MGQFSNGTEGEGYREDYCDKCKHDTDQNCRIWLAHLTFGYNPHKDAQKILDMLIPISKDGLHNEECRFYEPQTKRIF